MADEPDPLALLGPASVSWQLLRPWRRLGLQRNVLMQLARPEIAGAIAQHSDFMEHPLARFSRTMGVLATVRHGSPAERDAVLARLAAVHDAAAGRTATGLSYSAADPELQWWVLACGIDTALEVERRFHRRLSARDRERFYAEQREVVTAFGIPLSFMPGSVAAFQELVRSEVQRLEVTDDARRIASVLLDPATLPFPQPIGALARLVTVGLLPDELRAPYGLDLSSSRARRVAAAEATVRAAMRTAGFLNRHLPGQPVRRAATLLEARLRAA